MMVLCNMSTRTHIAIIGGGPAGMMAADTLAPVAEVDLYEHGKAIGRKFLVAGQGGFNLTNEAEGPELLRRYLPPGPMDEVLSRFGPMQLRAWLAEMGIETFVGTSGRVFPVKGIKPIEVLARIRERLIQRGVRIHTEHVFTGFDGNSGIRLENKDGAFTIRPDRAVFALGGASWPITGSTGIWPTLFATLGVETRHFEASNCGVEVAWPSSFTEAHAGKPLKNIRVQAGMNNASGEATITGYGLEGNAIYPVVPTLRSLLKEQGCAELRIDLKPSNNKEELVGKMGSKDHRNFARAIHLNRVSLALIKAFTAKERAFTAIELAEDIKNLRIPVTGLRPIGEAISTVGGIPFSELSSDLSLKREPRFFTIGEMVDWDAPTGGFLLQGCFAMGRHAALAILHQIA